MHNHPLPAGAGKLRAAAFAWMLAAPLSLGFLVSCGGGGSSPAPVTPTPTIGTHPAAATAAEGATATFTVVASGSGTLSYQWLRNGVTLSGATSASYTTPATTYAADNGASFTVQVWSGNSAKATSSAAVLTVTPVAPVIGTQPANATVTDGQPATFSVAVSAGSAPLSYQWYKGNTAIVSGGNTASYTTGNTLYQYDNNTTYKVEVTNAAGQKVMSDVVTLSVTPIAPSISTQPSSAAVADGQQATFTVAATGTLPITYQWKKNGSNATEPSATYATFGTMADYGTNNGASYTCVVTNGAGQTVTSDAATLTVTPVAPTIVYAPANRTVLDGGNATFSVTASGTAPLSYQWFRNDVDLGAGARNSSYTTPNAVYSSDNNAQYHCVVTNQVTSVPSSKGTLTVTPIAPTFSTDATAQTATDGTAATFSVAATGTAPLSYQWYRNDVAITTGATSASYTTPATVYASDNNAQYHCVVTNGASQTATSTKVALTVTPIAPTISVHPLPATVTDGQTAGFSVTASGTAPLTYQWKKDGVNAPGASATTASYTTPATEWQTYNNAKYTCIVTNGAGQDITSNEAALTVTPVAPAFSTDAVARTVTDGQTATFNVVATGTAPLSYQWYRNDVAITTGGTGQSYTTPATVYASDNGAQFHCVVTNGPGATATGGKVALTVTPIAPSITTQPVDVAVTTGATATFSVVASGTATLNYQWYKDNVSLGASGQAASYTTPATVSGDNGAQFKVEVTNVQGTATSNTVTLTVGTGPVAPGIVTQPSDYTVIAPASPTFKVVATGTNLSYQWYKGGTAVTTNGTSATYTDPITTDLQTVPTTYYVVVSGDGPNVTSNTVTYTVNAPNPTYVAYLSNNTTVAAGDPVAYTGGPTLTESMPSVSTYPQAPRGAFRFAYDESKKNPAWTAYADFKVNLPYTNSGRSFNPDTRLATPRVDDGHFGSHTNLFYKTDGSGFDRGHMVTMSDISYRYSDTAGGDSCYMSNVIPQVSYFNQRIWQNLESAVGGSGTGASFNNGLSATFGRVWIYTGPIYTGTVNYWLPAADSTSSGGSYSTTATNPAAGQPAIAIPTAAYKMMVVAPAVEGQLPRVLVWIGANKTYTTSESSTDIWKYVSSLENLENLTGIDFFPNFTKDATYNTWRKTVDVRGWGSTFESTTLPNVHIVQPSWNQTVSSGTTVTFEGAYSSNLGTFQSCSWSFPDDSSSSNLATTPHTFNAPGTYNVTFTATYLKADSSTVSNSITRTITVAAPAGNAAPTFGTIADQSSGINVPTTVTFSVNDDTTAAGNIVVTALSDNLALLPTDLTVGNTNGTCTLVLTPAADAEGTATITLTADDLQGGTSTKQFSYAVSANQAPTITGLSDTSITKNGTKTLNFTVGDAETNPALLTVTASSDKASLIPDTLTVQNVDGACTLVLTPVAEQTGTANITVNVSDGSKTASKVIVVTVSNPGITETFDGAINLATGSAPSGYLTGTVSFPISGNWAFVNTLMGTPGNNDRCSGGTGYALRLYNSSSFVPGTNPSKVTMNAPFALGCSTVSVMHAAYGTDAGVIWSLWYKTDSTSWTQAGTNVSSDATLQTATFTINVNAPVYFEIRNETVATGTAKRRLNIDDFKIVAF